MTFIDETTRRPTTFQVLSFIALTIASVVCCAFSARRGFSRPHYRNIFSISVLFPLCCLICAFENATLSASRVIVERDGNAKDLAYLKFLFCIQSMEVPILLMVAFDLTYLTHKRRSVNFCGLYFDEGHRVNKVITTPMVSFFLRNLIRAIVIILFTTGIYVNFDINKDATRIDDLAGKSGWYEFFRSDFDWDKNWPLFLSLLPSAILIVCCFYFSIILWRYGTTSAMIVHSSCANRWFAPFFGTLALTGGQFFAEEWYPLASNGGFLILIITLLLLMSEIDKELVQSEEFADYLNQVAKKGDTISVRYMLDEKEEKEIAEDKNHNHNEAAGISNIESL